MQANKSIFDSKPSSNMRYFIYTVKEDPPALCYPYYSYTVRVYRIKRGVPVFLAEVKEAGPVKITNLVMQALEETKLLPSRCFERHNGSYKFTLWQLQEEGYATINPVV